MTPLPAPSIEYAELSPMLIVFGVAVVGVLVEAFAPRRLRYGSQLVLALGGLAGAFAAVVLLAGTRHAAVLGAVLVDGPALFLQGAVLLCSMLAVLLMADRRVEPGRDVFAPQAAAVPGSVAELEATRVGIATTEVFPLTMLAVGGLMLFPASGDLLTMFVALEVFSLPLYVLCGLARRRRLLSQEAALKYFLLGAFSSAIFLYGIALLYGYAGTLDLGGIGAAIAAGSGDETTALLGVGLVAVGLLFKIGAVPFHSWIPDVYQGAPTPVTAFMAAATKIAAFGALLRILYVAVDGLRSDWRPILWAVAIATMVVGVVVAVSQTDVKRMLAYSSVAHAGFILTGVIAGDVGATMFYLLAYGFSTIGAFAVVGLVRDAKGEATETARWAGLGRRSPALAVAFALFLLGMAGIPLTSGFISKFVVFAAAAGDGAAALVVVGVVCSAIAAFFYVRVIVIMFFDHPADDAPEVATGAAYSIATVAVCAAVTVVLGIFPQPVLDLAERAGTFL